MKPNKNRNKELVRKRINTVIANENSELEYKDVWTFDSLARFYNIHKTTVSEIFNRDMEKYATEEEQKIYKKWLHKRGNVNRR